MKKLVMLLGLFFVVGVFLSACDDGTHGQPPAGQLGNDNPTGSGQQVPTGSGPTNSAGSGSGDADSGAGTTLADLSLEADASGTAFSTIMDDVVGNCKQDKCDCQSGGTVQVSDATNTLKFENCATADGMVFTGSITEDESGETVSGMFSSFGSCQNMQLIAVKDDDCGGKISGVCGGKAVNCILSDNPNDSVCFCNADVQ